LCHRRKNARVSRWMMTALKKGKTVFDVFSVFSKNENIQTMDLSYFVIYRIRKYRDILNNESKYKYYSIEFL
jgi:hypothetical protein